MAIDGPAKMMESKDIGVGANLSKEGLSIHRVAKGYTGPDFSWEKSREISKGKVNKDQTFDLHSCLH